MRWFHRPRQAMPATLMVIAALSSSSGDAATIGFDDYPSETPITNQYQPSGVLFESNAGLPAHAVEDAPEATSQPNILVGIDNFADIFVRFVDPSTGLPSPEYTATCAELNVISVGHAEITVSSRSSAGDVLEAFVLNHPDGPPNGLANVDPLTFSIAGIASIDVVFTQHAPPGTDGIGIDDLEFGFGEPCFPVPVAPATWGQAKANYR